jgi:hypothetical protein
LQTLPHAFGTFLGLWRQSNQYIGLPAKKLNLCILKASVAQAAADLFKVCRLFVTDFKQNAAREVDTELQTTGR